MGQSVESCNCHFSLLIYQESVFLWRVLAAYCFFVAGIAVLLLFSADIKVVKAKYLLVLSKPRSYAVMRLPYKYPDKAYLIPLKYRPCLTQAHQCPRPSRPPPHPPTSKSTPTSPPSSTPATPPLSLHNSRSSHLH